MIWHARSGDIEIKNMSTKHLENAICWAEEHPFPTWWFGVPRLRRELRRRRDAGGRRDRG